MISRNLYFLTIISAVSFFPLNASVSSKSSAINLTQIYENENTEESKEYLVQVAKKSSKEKKADKKALKRQKELMEKRAKAEAAIAERKEAAEREERERLEKEEAERLEKERQELEEQQRLEKERQELEEQQRLEQERIAAEKAEEERIAAEKAEEERLLEEKKLEEERLEKERLEKLAEEQKKEQEKLQKQMELELEKQKAESVKKRKEYLSDYMVYDIETIDGLAAEDTPYERISKPDEKDHSGKTLLMKAAQSGDVEKIRQLIYSNANLNLKDNDGWTALMYAVRYSESFECLEELLQAGADTSIRNNYGSSALILAACYNKNPKILKKLFEKYKSSDKEVLRAMIFLLSEHNISEEQQLSMLQIFMDESVPLNVLYEGKTPLMYAAAFGNSTKLIQLLLDNQANPTLRSTEGKTAFDYAMKNNSLAHDEAD